MKFLVLLRQFSAVFHLRVCSSDRPQKNSLIWHACIIVETKVFGALFHWKLKTIVKRPLTCWWLCQDLDKVTSDWLQRKSPLTCIFVETKTIGFLYHCHEDLSDLNSLNIGWRATPDSESLYVTIFFSNKPQDALAKEKARRVTGKELTSIKAK